MPEQFVDEGVYSLCSMESNKERHAQPATQHDEGENMGQANLDLNKSLWAAMHVPEEKTDENKVEQEREGRNRSQLEMGGDSVEEPLSLKLCSGTEKAISQDANSPEPVEADRSQPELNTNLLTANLFLEIKEQDGVEESSQEDTECTKKVRDPSRQTGIIEGQLPTETTPVSRESSSNEPEGKTAGQSKSSPEEREKMETIEETNKEAFQNEQTQDETNEGGSNGHTDVQENPGSESVESNEYSHHEPMAQALDGVSQQDSLCSSKTYSESGAVVQVDIGKVKEEPVTPCDLYFNLTSTVKAEVGLPAETTESNLVVLCGDLTDPPNGHQETLNPVSVSVVQTEQDGAEQGANAEVSPANGTLVTHTEGGLFYTNVDRGSRSEELFGEPLEPMDLFYPDKEDTMLPDPAQMDAECLPSVFGVFALQPAPVSEPLLPEIDPMGEGTDTGNPKVPDEDCDDGGKLPLEKMREVLDPEESRPKSHVVMIGGWDPRRVGPTEDGNLGREGGEGRGQSIAKGNTETLSDGEGSRVTGEGVIPTVLRHRKAAGVFNSSDKQMIVPIIKINSNNADLGEDSLLDRELYLLLLLWLLLYCLWLLPQMEFRALPSLLFNLDH